MEQVQEMSAAAGLTVAADKEGDGDVVEANQAGDTGWIAAAALLTERVLAFLDTVQVDEKS
jgi:hypothetical protein